MHDDNDLPFQAESEVLDGYFFQITKEYKKGTIYKLIEKQSFIHKDTVISVGIELDDIGNGRWRLSPIGHSEVLQMMF